MLMNSLFLTLSSDIVSESGKIRLEISFVIPFGVLCGTMNNKGHVYFIFYLEVPNNSYIYDHYSFTYLYETQNFLCTMYQGRYILYTLPCGKSLCHLIHKKISELFLHDSKLPKNPMIGSSIMQLKWCIILS